MDKNRRRILPTIPRPSTTIPQLPPDSRPGGHGHVRGLWLPGHHPRVQPQLQAHTRLPTRFRRPPWSPGSGGRGVRMQPCGSPCFTVIPGKSTDGIWSCVSVWMRAAGDRVSTEMFGGGGGCPQAHISDLG